MKQVVDFKNEYKDEILKFVSTGIVVAKHPSFNLSNEIGIFVGGNKLLKSSYKCFIALNSNKVPTGGICVDKDGEILLLAVEKGSFEDALNRLICKCDELLNAKKYLKISGRADPKYILEFNDRGYKTIRFYENESSEFKFLVQKTRSEECKSDL